LKKCQNRRLEAVPENYTTPNKLNKFTGCLKVQVGGGREKVPKSQVSGRKNVCRNLPWEKW